MKTHVERLALTAALIVATSFVSTPSTRAQPAPHSFKTVVYIPVGITMKMKDQQWLESSWATIRSQVQVDKVYLETYRSRQLANEKLVAEVKEFFTQQGVEVSGAICFSDDDNGQFASFTYTKPEDRAYVKYVSEMTAKLFDEIILDDFFFANTKKPSDIAAKGDLSWTDFRVKTMDEVSRELVVGAAKAVNPKVKIIIKFPNWYEHFQGNGYDLAEQPRIFDAIYTGTEARDPVQTDQNLRCMPPQATNCGKTGTVTTERRDAIGDLRRLSGQPAKKPASSRVSQIPISSRPFRFFIPETVVAPQRMPGSRARNCQPFRAIARHC